ncbi:hypothetical protein [Lactobacillus taiwanensis]|uniref:hypothetical protein n=1 Tax=Lactobacillus taiwanensis TaxID=508451 RepID=UPI00321F9D99
MKEITVRHNKNYTTVFINVINRKNFLRAVDVSKKEVGATVIKPSKKSIPGYKTVYKEDLLMKQTKIGHSFEIMGVVFTVVEKSHRDITLEHSYYDNSLERDVKTKVTMFYGQSLLENVFTAVTNGDLLFF